MREETTGPPIQAAPPQPSSEAEISTSLPTEESTWICHKAAFAVMFCVLCEQINVMCCSPNYASMVTPGGAGAFLSTAPFDLAAAQYAIQCSAQNGIVVSSLVFGFLSGKIGTRKVILFCAVARTALTVAKYYAQSSFWGFLGLNFANGMCASSEFT